MNATLPTETEIAAADFSGETIASMLAIARSYDREHEGTVVEDGVRALLAAGWTVEAPVLDLAETPMCPIARGWDSRPNEGGWRVPAFAFADRTRRFRTVLVYATAPDGREAQIAISQVSFEEVIRGRRSRVCTSKVRKEWLKASA
jgi:hypothetical protein